MWLDSLHHALHVALTGEQDGYYADFDGSMSRIAAELSRPEGAEDRGVRPESRPGRQPRVRRPASAGQAARGCGCRALQPLHAAPLPGRGVRRDRAVPVLHRPHRSVHRDCDARGPAARVRPLRRLRGRGPRPAGRGDLRAVQARRPASRRSSTFACSACGASCRASWRSRWTKWLARSSSAAAAPHCAPISPTRPWSSRREALARASFPARPVVGRRGNQLLALLRARREGRALPLRRGGPRDALRVDRAHRVQLARLPRRGRAGAAVRVPRPRPLGAGARPPLQPEQAPARPVREVDRGADPLGPWQHASRTVRTARTPISSATTRTTPPRSRSRS